MIRVLNYFIKNNTGRHEDVAVAKGFLSGLDEDLVSVYEQILTRTLNLGIGVKGYNEAFPENKIKLLQDKGFSAKDISVILSELYGFNKNKI